MCTVPIHRLSSEGGVFMTPQSAVYEQNQDKMGAVVVSDKASVFMFLGTFFILVAIIMVGAAVTLPQPVFIPIGGVAMIVGLMCLVVNNLYRSNRLEVHESGVIQFQSGERQGFTWDEVSQVYQRTYKTRQPTGEIRRDILLRIITEDGREFRLEGEDYSDDILFRIARKLAETLKEHILPDARYRYQTGQILSFGPVQIHEQTGLIYDSDVDRRRYSWDQITAVEIEDGRNLTFHLADGDHAWAIDMLDVPNACVLMHLLREEMGDRVTPYHMVNFTTIS